MIILASASNKNKENDNIIEKNIFKSPNTSFSGHSTDIESIKNIINPKADLACTINSNNDNDLNENIPSAKHLSDKYKSSTLNPENSFSLKKRALEISKHIKQIESRPIINWDIQHVSREISKINYSLFRDFVGSLCSSYGHEFSESAELNSILNFTIPNVDILKKGFHFAKYLEHSVVQQIIAYTFNYDNKSFISKSDTSPALVKNKSTTSISSKLTHDDDPAAQKIKHSLFSTIDNYFMDLAIVLLECYNDFNGGTAILKALTRPEIVRLRNFFSCNVYNLNKLLYNYPWVSLDCDPNSSNFQNHKENYGYNVYINRIDSVSSNSLPLLYSNGSVLIKLNNFNSKSANPQKPNSPCNFESKYKSLIKGLNISVSEKPEIYNTSSPDNTSSINHHNTFVKKHTNMVIHASPFIEYHLANLQRLSKVNNGSYKQNYAYNNSFKRQPTSSSSDKISQEISFFYNCFRTIDSHQSLKISKFSESLSSLKNILASKNEPRSESPSFSIFHSNTNETSELASVKWYYLVNTSSFKKFNILRDISPDFYNMQNSSLEHYLLSRPFLNTPQLRNISFSLLNISIADESLNWENKDHILFPQANFSSSPYNSFNTDISSRYLSPTDNRLSNQRYSDNPDSCSLSYTESHFSSPSCSLTSDFVDAQRISQF
ncbi:hypothetical protein AYI69_g5283 [Smittium culicis]|nr:hypothetical protein AYI69_g5283 [Smittium culicis]